MGREYLLGLVNMEGVLAFFRQNYPVDEEEVKVVVEEAKSNETIHLRAASYLMYKVNYVAERIGIVHDRDFPKNHLPTMLAAVKSLEESVSSESKLLTHKRTLELLAAGEITSAHESANRLRSFEGVRKHLQRADKLLKFREDLEK